MPDISLPPNRLKTKVAAAELPTHASLMTLAVSVVVVTALYFAREVLVPITLAILLSFVLAPLVSRLRRLGLWRVPAVILAVLLALGIIVVLGGVIGIQLANLADRATYYTETVQEKISRVRTYTTEQLAALTARVDVAAPPAAAPSALDGGVPGAGPGAARNGRPGTAGRAQSQAAAQGTAQGGAQGAAQSAPERQKPTPVEVFQPDPTPFQLLERLAAPIVGPLGSVGIMLVVAIFILMQMEDLRDRMIRLFGSGDLHRTTVAMDDAAARLSRYFLAQLALNAGFGVIVAAGLFVLGIPSPALFGIIAALFRFVPYIGAVGAALLPIALAAAVDPGWTLVIETVAMFVVVEGITGQVIEPLAYGHTTGLSPVSVVVSAIFWTWLWGPVGLILSMPLTLCLVVLGRHVEHLKFIDVMLGDQPALTPAESFYQRILAGDEDEALDQAEALLKDRPLSTYYDEVALKGLRMAANDQIRGVLTPEQLGNVINAIGGVVMDLADQSDDGPRQETQAGTVLCVSGRGPLDEAACTMLAQILAKRGMNARVVSNPAVARGAIDGLDVSGVGVICISYLEAAGSLSGLRYLMRRLRLRAPGVPVLVGLWQAPGDEANQERLKSVTEADHYTTTIAGAVAACITSLSPAPALEPA